MLHENIKILNLENMVWPVTLQELADQLHVDNIAAETGSLNDCIHAATEWAEDLCSRFFREVDVEYTQYGFDSFYLPGFPSVAPTSFVYYDPADGETAIEFLDTQYAYFLSRKGWQYRFYREYFTGGVFPDNHKVVVQYAAGMPVAQVPKTVKKAIKLKAGLLYAQKEDDQADRVISLAERLLYNERMHYV